MKIGGGITSSNMDSARASIVKYFWQNKLNGRHENTHCYGQA